eukprot:TRINITY_DN4618_c3_g1_i1.p1 TRINITY_DN4618_c3_g1~~TRINITY_DN4618_c3_g1_i1.p1  ORF type:complete len:458 (-),score=94.51 TRINITY_DN4618_c3_g1_i1:11-1192(-)
MEPDLWKAFIQRENLKSFGSISSDQCWRLIFRDSIVRRHSLKDFSFIKMIGKGCLGKVALVECKNPNLKVKSPLVIKRIKKEMLRVDESLFAQNDQKMKRYRANSERVMPFIDYFHSDTEDGNIYLMMDYCSGADMMTLLQKYENCTEDQARFFMVELVLEIEYIHKHFGAIKFLKPSNILRTDKGHLQISLSDFGLMTGLFGIKNVLKLNKHLIMSDYDKLEDRYWSVMETTITWRNIRRKMNADRTSHPYLAPEVILAEMEDSSTDDLSCDWWSLGAIFYEMLVGFPPFCDEDEGKMYQKIVNSQHSLRFPKYHMSSAAEDLIKKLLCDSSVRLNGESIKNHPFFNKTNWSALQFAVNNHNITSVIPFLPVVSHPTDTTNFEEQDEEVRVF